MPNSYGDRYDACIGKAHFLPLVGNTIFPDISAQQRWHTYGPVFNVD